MTNAVFAFLHDDEGAVTVDWVVLTAAVVALAVAAFAMIDGGVASLTAKIQALLQSFIVG